MRVTPREALQRFGTWHILAFDIATNRCSSEAISMATSRQVGIQCAEWYVSNQPQQMLYVPSGSKPKPSPFGSPISLLRWWPFDCSSQNGPKPCQRRPQVAMNDAKTHQCQPLPAHPAFTGGMQMERFGPDFWFGLSGAVVGPLTIAAIIIDTQDAHMSG